jgi:hypothetical protein
LNASSFLSALGSTLARHPHERPQREAANASSWMLFMRRILAEVAEGAGLHVHVGDVFDLAFSPKERNEWAPPVVTIAHDDEWTDAQVSARLYEVLVSFAPLRIAFVYPDMPPDECAKHVVELAGRWTYPEHAEDLVLIGDPRGVHFRWPHWRILRRERGRAFADLGLRDLRTTEAKCLCAAAREAAEKEPVWTRKYDAATAATIMSGSDCLSESFEASHYRCRSCGARWSYVLHSSPMIDFHYLEPSRGCSCAELLASAHWVKPLPGGRAEKEVIEGSALVSADASEYTAHYRCSKCNQAWTQRRYDSGHVSFDYLEPG